MQSSSVILVAYVDDIIITRSYYLGIDECKSYLSQYYRTKDLGKLISFWVLKCRVKGGNLSFTKEVHRWLSRRDWICKVLKPLDTPMGCNEIFGKKWLVVW